MLCNNVQCDLLKWIYYQLNFISIQVPDLDVSWWMTYVLRPVFCCLIQHVKMNTVTALILGRVCKYCTNQCAYNTFCFQAEHTFTAIGFPAECTVTTMIWVRNTNLFINNPFFYTSTGLIKRLNSNGMLEKQKKEAGFVES